MEKKTANNLKLGIFILSGLLTLVVSLYLVGQNHNFFGASFSVKARFRDINGLMPGNNVRFSGIQCGTVKSITIINDTTIEISMMISEKTSTHIRTNARASIGTEGLMGNKVVNITPGLADAPAIADGGMLPAASARGVDDIINTLSSTGDNALGISADLKNTAGRINNSPLLIELLADTTMGRNLRQSLENFKAASADIREASAAINHVAGGLKNGKGAAGILLTDSAAARQMSQSIDHIHSATQRADQLLADADSLANDLHYDLHHGRGTAQVLLRDTSVATGLRQSIDNINKGTNLFSQDMEALKHNILFRRYFRKKGKR